MNTEHILSTLTSFLTETNTSFQHYKRKYKIMYPDEYTWIINNTHLTDSSPFFEILYSFENNITKQPICKHCGTNNVSYRPGLKRYLDYCSSSCTISIAAAQSNTNIAKAARKETMQTRYGVSNAFQTESTRKVLSEKKLAYWQDHYSNKDFTKFGLTTTQYRHRANQYAETQYKRFKERIDPDNLRSKDYHLDHVFSVADGFINDVPIDVISDVSNLRIINASENLSKSKTSGKTIEQLYEDYKKGVD